MIRIFWLTIFFLIGCSSLSDEERILEFYKNADELNAKLMANYNLLEKNNSSVNFKIGDIKDEIIIARQDSVSKLVTNKIHKNIFQIISGENYLLKVLVELVNEKKTISIESIKVYVVLNSFATDYRDIAKIQMAVKNSIDYNRERGDNIKITSSDEDIADSTKYSRLQLKKKYFSQEAKNQRQKRDQLIERRTSEDYLELRLALGNYLQFDNKPDSLIVDLEAYFIGTKKILQNLPKYSKSFFRRINEGKFSEVKDSLFAIQIPRTIKLNESYADINYFKDEKGYIYYVEDDELNKNTFYTDEREELYGEGNNTFFGGISFGDIQSRMKEHFNRIGHEYADGKVVTIDGKNAYVFLSQPQVGMMCVTLVDAYSGDITTTDCGSGPEKIILWNSF